MPRNNTYRALQGTLGRETEKAILLRLHCPEDKKNHNTQVWFPLSQIASIHRTANVEAGTFDVLMVSEWLLGEKTLLDCTVKDWKQAPEAKKEILGQIDDDCPF